MDKLSYIVVNFFICLIFVSLSGSEIHRAKINSKVYSEKKSDSSYVADSVIVSETESDSKMENNSSLSGNILTSSVSQVWLCSIFCSMIVGLCGIFPLLVIPIEAGPTLKHGAGASLLKLLLSFAVGGLLGDVFLHLLPEAWAHIKPADDFHGSHTKIGGLVIVGMLTFLIIEKMLAKEGEFEHLEDECAEAMAENEKKRCKQLQEGSRNCLSEHNDNVANRTRQKAKKKLKETSKKSTNNSDAKTNGISKNKSKVTKNTPKETKNTPDSENPPTKKISGYLNLAANVIDNFTHGLAVAGGFLVSNKVGCITTLAILLHEIPHEIGDFAILLRSGFDRWEAAKAQLFTAMGGMIGALTALMADSAQAAGEKTMWVLPFTSGGFLYIALVTVVPDLLEEKHPRESTKQILCLLAGIGVMYLVCLVH